VRRENIPKRGRNERKERKNDPSHRKEGADNFFKVQWFDQGSKRFWWGGGVGGYKSILREIHRKKRLQRGRIDASRRSVRKTSKLGGGIIKGEAEQIGGGVCRT